MKRIRRYIWRLWRWAKFLWKEEIEEWDPSYMLRVFQFELSLMRENMEADKNHGGTEQRARQMRICEILLKRMADDDYRSGPIHPDLGIGSEEWEKWVNDNRKGIRRAWMHENYMYNEDAEMLGKILGKHSRGWWT